MTPRKTTIYCALLGLLIPFFWGIGSRAEATEYVRIGVIANRHMGTGGISDTSKVLRIWIPDTVQSLNGDLFLRVFIPDGTGRMVYYVAVEDGASPDFVKQLSADFAKLRNGWTEKVQNVYGAPEIVLDSDPSFSVRLSIETGRRRKFARWTYQKMIVDLTEPVSIETLAGLSKGGDLIDFLEKHNGSDRDVERLSREGVRSMEITLAKPGVWTGFLRTHFSD